MPRTKLASQQFKRDLRLGMSRSEVGTYLAARQIAYNEIDWNYDVGVGQDPGGSIFCEKWNVYIEMHFILPRAQPGSSSADRLDDIHIRRIGTCL